MRNSFWFLVDKFLSLSGGLQPLSLYGRMGRSPMLLTISSFLPLIDPMNCTAKLFLLHHHSLWHDWYCCY